MKGLLLIIFAGVSFALEDPLSKAYYHLIRAKQEIEASKGRLDKELVLRMLDSIISSVRAQIPDPNAVRNALLLKEEIRKDLLSYERLKYILEPFEELAVVSPRKFSCGRAEEIAKEVAEKLRRPSYVIRFEGLCRIGIGGFRRFEDAVRFGKRYFESFSLFVVR